MDTGAGDARGDAGGGAASDSEAGIVDAAFEGGDSSGTFTCPSTAEPRYQPCVIDESLGVFVSPHGQPSAPGTRAWPLKSINAAIALAKTHVDGGVDRRVYACGGVYDEMVAVDAAHDGVQLFGGLACADWSYTGEKTALSPSARGVPLTLSSLTRALFVDFEIHAQSAPATPPPLASASGDSSIAVAANLATGVEFRRAFIVAGDGQPGAAGTLASFAFPAVTDLLGNPAGGGLGGVAKTVTCPGGLVSTGGRGGDIPASPILPGNPGDPGLPPLGGGGGDSFWQCVIGQGGSTGADAAPGSNGTGAAAPGSLSSGGVWRPSPGIAGSLGGPGQGGGGGASISPGGGGGGAAGGCGGAGGGAGGGGGASAAVVAFGSPLTLTDTAMVSGTAGSGGAGAAGQAGQPQGGNGGLPDRNGGCPGGRGGAGGGGGSGGGGAGGVSAGVLYAGTAPTLDVWSRVRSAAGQAGTKGVGGSPGVNDGVSGISGVILAAP